MNPLPIPHLRSRARIAMVCAVFVLLGAIGTALLLPRLIDPDTLKARLSAQVNARLDGALHTDRLEWAWLPLPHLNLRNTSFTSEETALAASLTEVYPDWWALFQGKVRIA